MHILGIESSCDDTSVALIKADKNNFKILTEKTASQIEVHKKYGGVVPEVAGRKHAENILPVLEEVLKDHDKPDIIAINSGPGLITGLLVGVEVAKTLSYLWNIPLANVNHIEGHIHSTLIPSDRRESRDLSKLAASTLTTYLITPATSVSKDSSTPLRSARNKLIFPALCLVASGGHTELILMKNHGKYKLIGKTRDDAAGECFDKVAKLLGLDYPGGPQISRLAETGNPNVIPFPRPMIDDESFDFSFAGLKTAALYWLQKNAKKQVAGYKLQVAGIDDFCASFEQAIIDVLVGKTIRAAKKYKPKTIILAGGVSANKKLRNTLKIEVSQLNPPVALHSSPVTHSMDNSAMIALAGYFHAIKKNFTPWQKLEADPNWKIYKL